MHLAIIVLTTIASFFFADWKRWREFYPTMQYVVIGNLLYHFIVQDYHLWEYHSDLRFLNFTVIELGYTLVVFPLIVAMYLSHYPDTIGKQIMHNLKWIVLFSTIEAIGHWSKTIDYHNGWGYWWSVFFNVTMFPMIRLHYRYPFWALLVSIPIAVFYLLMFHIPLTHKLVQ